MTVTKQGTIIKFSGHSDDVIEWEMINPNNTKNQVVQDEITAAEGDVTRILVTTLGGVRGVYVFAMYDGCWHFSVRQLDEDRKIPANWDISIDQMDGSAYSARLCIDAFRNAGDVLARPMRVPL